MIELDDVSVFAHDEGRKRFVLTEVTLSVRAGELVSLVGANGSGKTTLGSIMCGLRQPDAGTVRVCGHELFSDEGEHEKARGLVGWVRQHPADQLVSTIVFDEVAFGPRNLGLCREEIETRVREALRAAGLEGTEDRLTTELSGGEQQRLAVAGVLAMRPRFMVLDEATSMVDSAVRPAFRDMFTHLCREDGIGLVQITHDPEEVLASDRVVVLQDGKVVWEGAPLSLLENNEALWGATVSSGPTVQAVRELVRAGVHLPSLPIETSLSNVFNDALSTAMRDGLLTWDLLERLRTLLTPEGRPTVSDACSQDGGLVCENVSFSYDRADGEVLRDVSLHVHAGEVVLLAGASGSGKSTLARLLAGLDEPSEGRLTVADAPPRPGRCALAMQRPEDQFFLDTVFDEIAFCLRRRGLGETELRQAVLAAADMAGVDEILLERYPFDVSGGQARRVALASTVAMSCAAYVFDEPTAGLDVLGRAKAHRMVRDLAQKGCAVLVISHDLEEWLAVADRVCLLGRGSLVWQGSVADVADAPDLFSKAGLRPPSYLTMLQGVSDVEKRFAAFRNDA